MPDLSAHFIKDKLKFLFTVLGQVKTKLKCNCISFSKNNYELTMPRFMENSVDIDQLASSTLYRFGKQLM